MGVIIGSGLTLGSHAERVLRGVMINRVGNVPLRSMQRSGLAFLWSEPDFGAVTLNTATDLDLWWLRGLHETRDLLINSDRITNAGILGLPKLKGLQGVHIYNAQVADDGLRHLVSGTQLSYLTCVNTAVTDQIVPFLTQFQLRHLMIDGAERTGVGFT